MLEKSTLWTDEPLKPRIMIRQMKIFIESQFIEEQLNSQLERVKSNGL